jgi:hypothetical protein
VVAATRRSDATFMRAACRRWGKVDVYFRRALLARSLGGPARWLIWPVLVSGVLIAHQWRYIVHPASRAELSGSPKIDGSVTIHDPTRYDYGFYYWGIIPAFTPVVSDRRKDASLYSREVADRILVRNGETLRMQHHALLCGERTVKIMTYPLALARGGPLGVTHVPVLGGTYLFGLILLTFALWRYAPFPLCVFLPLVLSSSRFVLGDIYGRGMLHTPPILAVVYAAALLAPVIFNRRIGLGSLLLRFFALSAVMVFLMNLRSDALPALGGAVLLLLLHRRSSVRRRVLSAAALVLIYAGVSGAFDAWWDFKREQAARVVESVGGEQFRGVTVLSHPVWETLLGGACDFDKKYGTRWDDNFALRIGKRRMAERGQKFDPAIPYYVMDPQYQTAVRDVFFEYLRRDPIWYLDILVRRIGRILWENEPPALDLVFRRLTFPVSPLPWVAALGVLALFRAGGYLRLVLLFLTTMTVPFLISTYINRQLLSIAHLVLAAILLTMVARVAGDLILRRHRRPRPLVAPAKDGIDAGMGMDTGVS